MCTLLACLVSGAPWWGGDRQTTKFSLCLSHSPVSSIDVSIWTQSERERMRDTEKEKNRGKVTTKQTLSMPMQNPTVPLLVSPSVFVLFLSDESQYPALRIYDFSALSVLTVSLFLKYFLFYPISLLTPLLSIFLSHHLFFP